MITKQVVPEKLGGRDQKISERHRLYGFNCPAVDIDLFLVVEYTGGSPSAIVGYTGGESPSAILEMKHSKALGKVNKDSQNIRVIEKLCNSYSGGALPMFIVYYYPGS